MFKIDKTLVDNMNMNRSVIMITHKETKKEPSDHFFNDKADYNIDQQVPSVVKDRAREMLLEAQAKAQQIMQSATAKVEEMKAAAWKEGYNTGMAEADKKIEEMTEAKMAATHSLMEEVSGFRNSLYEELQNSVLGLSIDIAEKITNIQLQRDDKVYVEIVKKAIFGLKRNDNFTLRVGRTEYAAYFKDDVQWLKDETECGSFEVICDPNMEPGGCIAETDEEMVNTGVQMQLEKARKYLNEQVD